MGNSAHLGVCESNGVARRSAFIGQICIVQGVYVIIEQPADSVLFNFPQIKQPLNVGRVSKCGPSCVPSTPLDTDPAKAPRKELQLWGTPPWLPNMSTRCNHEPGTHVALMTKTGSGRGCNKTKALHALLVRLHP